ncbi:MAG TPA: DUF2934 domain-containing protein [Candidatus Acidoferrales bacterium]|nr:DUF2934 domain-containing protein [Candidatus Acidoferrales bacterium]
MARTPSREEIERRAYEIYEQRGCEDGHADEHWLSAEQELAERPVREESGKTGSRIKTAVADAMHAKSANVRGAHN